MSDKDKERPKANLLVDRDIQTVEKESYEYKSLDGKKQNRK